MFLRKDRDKEMERELELARGQRHSQPPPQNAELKKGMSKALMHTAMMLKSDSYQYVNGGLMVNELEDGYVNVKGNLTLRHNDDVTMINRSYIGKKHD